MQILISGGSRRVHNLSTLFHASDDTRAVDLLIKENNMDKGVEQAYTTRAGCWQW